MVSVVHPQASERKSAFSVKTTRSISEIGRERWDSVYPPIPESYGFLKTSEETLSGQFTFYYVVVSEDLRPVFIAPCFVMRYPLDTTLNQGPLKRIIRAVRRAAPGFLAPRAVVCGSPACEGRFGMKDPSEREACMGLLVREMRSIAKRERASLLALKEFSDEYTEFLAPLAGMRFHKVPTLPSVELDIRFRSFEEYLASLSQATRVDLRRKFKKTDGKVTITMEVAEALGDSLDEAYALYVNTLQKSGMRFEVITKEFFRRISGNMPGVAKFFLWRIGGSLVAFHLCLVSNGVFIAEYLGFDYDAAYRYHLYFVVFRDEVNWCLQHGIGRYESGALNYDPKKRLDFRFVPQYVYARHRNYFMNIPFGLVTRLVKPENFDPILKAMGNGR